MTRSPIMALVLFLASCGPQAPSAPVAQDSIVSATDTVLSSPDLQGLNVQSGDFQEIGKTGMVLFPLTINETEEKEGKWSVKEYRSGASFYWNILFHDTHSGDTRLLSERKMLISQIHPPGDLDISVDTGKAYQHIFYRIRVDDVNKDGELTEKDPEYLFLSGLDGRDFRQVSPPGLHVRNWGHIKSTHTIMIVVVKDTNKDGVYALDDEELIYRMNIATESQAMEMVSGEMKARLKKLYELQWKHKAE